ncbi:hypothetical protein DNTS_011098 [Danionella cerebrum]|uniref:Uncharacterized protein n=1 Tax=Danionella cerebrum TaxID=2873325 RepID=A0A553RP20_9TELE|nr:hypothetical protein DNTS_011098 [Danionella translucida]
MNEALRTVFPLWVPKETLTTAAELRLYRESFSLTDMEKINTMIESIPPPTFIYSENHSSPAPFHEEHPAETIKDCCLQTFEITVSHSERTEKEEEQVRSKQKTVQDLHFTGLLNLQGWVMSQKSPR